jgi:[acyl-carrier-protein] S-malonyltransferase
VATFLSDPDEIRTQLAEQITGCVRWVECIEALVEDGVQLFVELGPGNVLTGLLKRIDKSVTGVAAGDPDGIEKVIEAVGALA